VTQEPDSAPIAATRLRAWRWVLHFSWVGALLVVAIGAGLAWLTTQQALDLAVARAVGASEGRLTVERATGSLLSTVRVARIAWRGDDVDVEADDVALTWSVVGLFTRHVNVSGLGAHRLAITMKGSDSALALPADLSLPLEVRVDNVGVERVEWRVGPRAGIAGALEVAQEDDRRPRGVVDAGDSFTAVTRRATSTARGEERVLDLVHGTERVPATLLAPAGARSASSSRRSRDTGLRKPTSVVAQARPATTLATASSAGASRIAAASGPPTVQASHWLGTKSMARPTPCQK